MITKIKRLFHKPASQEFRQYALDFCLWRANTVSDLVFGDHANVTQPIVLDVRRVNAVYTFAIIHNRKIA